MVQQDLAIPLGQQNPGHPGFVAAALPYDCRQCVAWHAERMDFPPLGDDAEAQEAWDTYFRLHGQQRAGLELLGLDWAVLPVAFDLWGIPRRARPGLFDRLCVMDREVQRWRERLRKQEAEKREMDRRMRETR